MNAEIFVLAAAAIFGLGLYGLIVAGHLMRKLLSLNLMLSAVFLLMVLVPGEVDGALDPVPQALVLTGIVIGVVITAFALILMLRVFRSQGHASIDPEIDPRLLRHEKPEKHKADQPHSLSEPPGTEGDRPYR